LTLPPTTVAANGKYLRVLKDNNEDKKIAAFLLR
jgi:hypothetical protein